MYLRNAWYVAGFSDEIAARRLLTRRLLDEWVVLGRKPDGSVGAFTDRGSHRFTERVATPAVDRHGLLWWWAGAATEANPDLIPDYGVLERAHPDATFRGYLPTQCHYEMLVDNILDLTHADYLTPELSATDR